jgi:glutathione S-transferase
LTLDDPACSVLPDPEDGLPAMKLYDAPHAPNPRRVRWVIAEKGISDLEIVSLDLLKGEQNDPGYVAKADLPLAPALELDSGRVITESLAICRYLESRYPEPNLFGRDPEEMAEIEMWTRRAELMAALPLMYWVRNTAPALAVLGPQDAAFGEHQGEVGRNGLTLLDARLAGREWLAADRLTIADIVAFIALDFTRLLRFRPPEDLVHLRRWAEAMRARPAASAGRGR